LLDDAGGDAPRWTRRAFVGNGLGGITHCSRMDQVSAQRNQSSDE
jgi:hypothetical protein